MAVDKALVVSGVTKRYGNVVALRDVSFEVDRGSRF
jgi:ABC-type multidrug transport system ATPase subunit